MIRRSLMGVTLLAVLGFAQGCLYLNNRVRDAGEVIDLGVTVSYKPGYAAFVIFPPIHLTLLGIGDVDGYFVGLGGGAPRLFSPYYERSIGLGVWGEETLSFEKSGDQLSKLSDAELRKECTFYHSGLFGLVQGPLPTEDYGISCPHYFHVGFVGAVMSPRYSEMADFFLGFLMIDINGDDLTGDEQPGPPRKPTQAGAPPQQPLRSPTSK